MLTHDDRVKLLGFRVRHDINQLHFSRGIISRNQLSNIENGKSSTTEKVLYQLYLRFCEYMIALNDYNRFHFDSLRTFGPYKKLQEALDLYDRVCEEELNYEEINLINLRLNHDHFGLINTYVFEQIGDIFLSRDDKDNAFTFYLKAYYNMTSSHVDEINIHYLVGFLTKITDLGLEMNKTFNVIEMLDHLDYLKNGMEGGDNNRDYLYSLALSYRKLQLDDKALETCKRVELINFNEGEVSKSATGKTFHLMGNIYYDAGAKDLGKKYHDKAERLLRDHGSDADLSILESDRNRLTR